VDAFWGNKMSQICMDRSWRFVALTLLVLALVVSGCSAIGAKSFQSENCNLASPPENSGEDGIHGTIVKIYPRKSMMGDSYSGCQTMWALEGERWEPVMVGIFENGEVARMKVPSQPGSQVEKCLVKSGVLVSGDNDICRDMDVFPYSSAQPKCLTATSDRDETCSYD
jgi:hypothetical protein